jgi:hypothetical protein
MTRTIRLAVIQYGDDPANPDTAIFAAGWDVDPDDRHSQDAIKIEAVKKNSLIPDRFIQSIRFIEVPVELTETEIGVIKPTSEEKPC